MLGVLRVLFVHQGLREPSLKVDAFVSDQMHDLVGPDVLFEEHR